MNLGSMLSVTALRYPNKKYLISGDRTLTYLSIDRLSTNLAIQLINSGLQRGDRVALLFPNSAELVISYFACFKIGVIAVPLNFRLKATELKTFLNHSEACVLLAEDTLYQKLVPIRHQLKFLKKYFISGFNESCEFESFEKLTHTVNKKLIAAIPEIRDSFPCIILYTSGTSGNPKGAVYTHRSLLKGLAHYVRELHFNSKSRILVALSICHAAAFGTLLLPGTYVGASLYLETSNNIDLLVQLLQEFNPTHFLGFPFHYIGLLHHPHGHLCRNNSKRTYMLTGDYLSDSIEKEFRLNFNRPIIAMAGMTEVQLYSMNPTIQGKQKTGSIGLPFNDVQIRLVDESNKEVNPGETGEIILKTDRQMSYYWHDEEQTLRTMRDGWIYTEDLGRRDEQGYYYLVGRKIFIIIRGGSKILPQEVESVLIQHPTIKEVAVTGLADFYLGQVVMAFIVIDKEAGGFTIEQLLLFIKNKIADYKIPEKIIIVSKLPRNASGKLDRKALAKWAANEEQPFYQLNFNREPTFRLR
ncbi:MAG: acyl--CoA ligase [Tatlockia sp.]|nr:acyl--CoA ligase [Tatlockia sp.]